MGHRYGRRGTWGLRECTLTVPAGRVVALVGPNGAGKTTLLHLAAGLLPPTEGSVHVAGAEPGRRLERIGFVAQDSPLWPRLRVQDVLGVGAHLNPRWDSGLASERIARLGIPPRANLDPLARREFLASMFDACTQSGAAVLFSSHVVAELERICDYLVVLAGGRVRLAGEIDELRHAHRVIAGPAGWSTTMAARTAALPYDAARDGGWEWRLISARKVAGRTTALVRVGGGSPPGPGLEAAEPTFDELVLGYLDQHDSDQDHAGQE